MTGHTCSQESNAIHTSVVTRVRFGAVRYRQGVEPVRWGAHSFEPAALIASVESSDGSVGIGAVWAASEDGSHLARAAQGVFPEAIINLDVLTPYASGCTAQQIAYGTGLSRAGSAVELALWDLAGRSTKMPVYQLLGCKRRQLPAYVISAEEFSFTSKEQYLELVLRYKEEGFAACKLHLWGEPGRDIEACIAIRKLLGDTYQLMLDPAGRYSRAEALRVGLAIQDLGFVRFEDPISPLDYPGYCWLSRRLDIPLVVNETLRWDTHQCAAAAAAGDVQGFRLELGRAGISKSLKMASITDAYGCELDIASLAPQIGLEACLHFGLSSPSTRWFEHHEMLGLNEIPGVSSGIQISGGIAVPDETGGFGFSVDWEQFNSSVQWAG